MKLQAFPKAEHLCLRNDIDQLFNAGSRGTTAFPLRAVYRCVAASAGTPPVKVLLSVPKRRLKLAVDRNRAKRQLRDAYRRHKHLLTDALPAGTAVNLGFIWLADAPAGSAAVSERMQRLLQLIAERIGATRPEP